MMYEALGQGMGEHLEAIRKLEEGLQHAKGERQVQLTYLKGFLPPFSSCHCLVIPLESLLPL